MSSLRRFWAHVQQAAAATPNPAANSPAATSPPAASPPAASPPAGSAPPADASAPGGNALASDTQQAAAPLKSIAIKQLDKTIDCPSQLQFTAEGTRPPDESKREDVTTSVIWTPSDPKLVSIDQKGKATALAAGRVTITAKDRNGNATASTSLTVLPPVLVSITITPASATINEKTTEQRFSALGEFANHTTADVTSQINWHSSNSEVVSMDENGVAHVHGGGSADITATAKDTRSKANQKATITVTSSSLPADNFEEVDLSRLKKQLDSTKGLVGTAIAAEEAMRKVKGVDLNKPDAGAVSTDDKKELQQLTVNINLQQQILHGYQHHVAELADDMYTAKDTLKQLAELPKDPSPEDTKKAKDVDDARLDMEHFADGLNMFLTFMEAFLTKLNLGVVHMVLGADLYKDWIKGEGKELQAVEAQGQATQAKLSQLVGALADAARKTYYDKRDAFKTTQTDIDEAMKGYTEAFADYNNKLSKLSSGKTPALRPEVAEAMETIKNAWRMSTDTRSELAKRYLAKDAFAIVLDQLKSGVTKPGSVAGKGGVLKENNGKQYFYRGETEATLKSIVEQLEQVKLVYQQGPAIDEIAKKWNDALKP